MSKHAWEQFDRAPADEERISGHLVALVRSLTNEVKHDLAMQMDCLKRMLLSQLNASRDFRHTDFESNRLEGPLSMSGPSRSKSYIGPDLVDDLLMSGSVQSEMKHG